MTVIDLIEREKKIYNESHGKKKTKPRQYPPEIKQQEIDLFNNCLDECRTRKAASAHVAGLLGIGGPETALVWARQAKIDQGARPGATTDDNEELRRLRRESGAEMRERHP